MITEDRATRLEELEAIVKGLGLTADKMADAIKSDARFPQIEDFGIDGRAVIVGAARIISKRLIDAEERLACADTRAKEMAGLLREGADQLEQGGAYTVCFCISCLGEGSKHKPDCLVTRLRTAADHAEKDRAVTIEGEG